MRDHALYVVAMALPFVPRELTGLTAIVSFFPAGSSDAGMSTLVSPLFGSWPMPALTPLKYTLLKYLAFGSSPITTTS